MRHRSGYSTLSRHPEHRRAMMRNMVMNLVEHGRIRTTIQKAKAAKPIAEKLITLGKSGSNHDRLQAISELGSTSAAKRAVKKLFTELKERFAARTGGYTRILRLPTTIRQAQADLPRGQKFNRSKFYGTRLGDNSTLVLWELCEAEVKPREKKGKAAKSKKAKPKAEAPKAAAKPKAAPAAPAAPAGDAGDKTMPATKLDLGQK